MLELVAAHADIWEVNLPPLAPRVNRAAEQLEAACRRRGRDPREIDRSMLLFVRPGADRDPALADYRRLNPWFHSVPDAEVEQALVLGGPARCRARIAELCAGLGIELPVLDASGLAAEPTRRLLEALAPGE
jgi:alkanesulfonate monooxygenase SsuD/methylene tetrahydromethanopterin reductase-like flavin-dependent oxidoreductase (luciferase family)